MRQERDHIDGGALAKLLALLVVVSFAAIGAASWLLGSGSPQPAPRVAPRTIGSIEQTQITRTAAGLEAHDAQRATLESWQWIDRDAGVGAIPIERAMQIVAGEAK